jgi:hypothetical protein
MKCKEAKRFHQKNKQEINGRYPEGYVLICDDSVLDYAQTIRGLHERNQEDFGRNRRYGLIVKVNPIREYSEIKS